MHFLKLFINKEYKPAVYLVPRTHVHATKVVKLNKQFSLFERTEKYLSKDRNVRPVMSQIKWLLVYNIQIEIINKNHVYRYFTDVSICFRSRLNYTFVLCINE